MKIKAVQSATHQGYRFFCPGCEEHHIVYISGHGPTWTFSGDLDNPTFTPSILCTSTRHKTMTEEDFLQYDALVERLGHEAAMQDPRFKHVCHSFVVNGTIQFLGDCTHHLANQTVPLPDLRVST